MPVPITYTNFVPPAIDAGNLNTVNNVVYTVIGDGTNAPVNAAAVRTNIGLGTMATQNANAVAITGGTAALASATLVAPLPTASGGNAVDMNTAWTTMVTGAVTSSTGTITTASGNTHYRIVGKTVSFTITVTIPNNGTGATGLLVAACVPVAPLAFSCFVGREVATNGKAITMTINPGVTNCVMQTYDNTYAGATGALIIISGVYESV